MSERQWLANIVFSLQWLRSCGIGVGNHIGTPGGALGPNWRTAIAGNACRSIFTSCGPPGGAYQPTTLPHRQVIYQSAFAAWHFDNGSTGWRYILDQTAASQSLAAFWMHSCDHYGVDLGTAETVAWEDAQKTIDYAMGATVDGRTIAKPCKIVSMDDISSGRLE